MEIFSNIISDINERLEFDYQLERLGNNSEIWISKKVKDKLEFFGGSLLTNEESQRVSKYNSNAYMRWADLTAEGRVTFDCAKAISKIVLNDNRSSLGQKIGLCYNWDNHLASAKNGQEKQVIKMCKKDLFILNTIGFLYNYEAICKQRNIDSSASMQNLAKTVLRVANDNSVSNYVFPKLEQPKQDSSNEEFLKVAQKDARIIIQSTNELQR